jgi:hypothetical protein
VTTAVLTPTSFEELLAVSGETARDLAGADQTAWNGHIVESTSAMLGLAHWDGTLYLDREAIVDPLRDLYEHAGERRPTRTLVGYRESLATLLHEHAHFLGPDDATQEAAREAFVLPGSRQLEEGVTEAWAQDHLDDYIHRLGIDKVAPGINSVGFSGYYPAFVPAVRRLAADLEARNSLPPGQVLQDLNRLTAAGQLPYLVDLATNLHHLEPFEADTRLRLESILRSGLAHLDTYELAPPGQAARHSLATANQILAHLHHETHTPDPIHPVPPKSRTRTPAAKPTPTRPPTPALTSAPALALTPAPALTLTLTPAPAPAPAPTATAAASQAPTPTPASTAALEQARAPHQTALSGIAPPAPGYAAANHASSTRPTRPHPTYTRSPQPRTPSNAVPARSRQ